MRSSPENGPSDPLPVNHRPEEGGTGRGAPHTHPKKSPEKHDFDWARQHNATVASSAEEPTDG